MTTVSKKGVFVKMLLTSCATPICVSVYAPSNKMTSTVSFSRHLTRLGIVKRFEKCDSTSRVHLAPLSFSTKSTYWCTGQEVVYNPADCLTTVAV